MCCATVAAGYIRAAIGVTRISGVPIPVMRWGTSCPWRSQLDRHPTISADTSTSHPQGTPSLSDGDVPRAAPRRRYGQHTTERPRFCYVCGYLLTAVEAVIGTHVRCVYEQTKRQRRSSMPSPSYGPKR